MSTISIPMSKMSSLTTTVEQDAKASQLASQEQPLLPPYHPHQHPFSITLDGTTIFLLPLTLLLTIHLQPHLTELLIFLTPFLLFAYNDYQNFLSLGPGGTPSTFQGYIRIVYLRLFALRDPFTPPTTDPTILPRRGILSKTPLPYRPGPRPLVAGIAPQRQLDQHGSERQYLCLRKTVEELSAANGNKLGTARSCFEKHGLGLFARHPVNKTCQGEIFHVHPSDHSMHMNLHPEDIKEVLEKGWGQRHPLARKGWFGTMPVPEDFVMIYAPRDEHELEIICRIIQGAMWFVMAEEIKIDVVKAL